jgi:peptidoglycan lytic transglycosylase
MRCVRLARARFLLLLVCVTAAGCARERQPRYPSAVPPSPGFGPPAAPAPAPAVEPPRAPGVQVGLASYYSQRLAGRKTASGERYDPNRLTAAHRTLPFGTMVEVRREDGRSVVVRINDRGPFGRGRVIDLSRRAAEALGMIRAGVVKVQLRPIGRR